MCDFSCTHLITSLSQLGLCHKTCSMWDFQNLVEVEIMLLFRCQAEHHTSLKTLCIKYSLRLNEMIVHKYLPSNKTCKLPYPKCLTTNMRWEWCWIEVQQMSLGFYDTFLACICILSIYLVYWGEPNWQLCWMLGLAGSPTASDDIAHTCLWCYRLSFLSRSGSFL